MKIIHLSTSDFRGAASRGALNLHRQLLARGIHSRFFARERVHDETGQIPSFEPELLSEITQKTCFDENLSSPLASSFTFGLPGNGQLGVDALKEADIIHLHDIKGLFSPHAVNRMLSLGKPVVWSFPDMWAFTGGCHHALECEGYRNDCKGCPQLLDDRQGVPSLLLKKKCELFAASNLHLVASSKWLAECASKSQVFRETPIHRISPVAPEAICPQSKRDAKEQLGLDPEAFALLLVCENTAHQARHREAVKQILQNCALYNLFRKLKHKDRFRVLVVGDSPEPFALDHGVIYAPNGGDNRKLSLFLSAADLAVLPHFEENGSHIIMEAAICGTPVIAMNSAEADEFIRDGVTGRLVPVGDLRRMAEEISYLALNPRTHEAWQNNCRAAAAEASKDSVEQHLELYGQLLDARPDHTMNRVEFSQLEVRHELTDLVPVLLENIESFVRAPRAREEAALRAVEELKRAIQTSIEKLSLAEKRIQKQLRGGIRNSTIENSVVSIGKLRKYFNRVLCENDSNQDIQSQYYRSCAPAASEPRPSAVSRKAGIQDSVIKLMYNSFLRKGHVAKPGVLQQYAPRPLSLERFPKPRVAARKLPSIAIVTPSYMQGPFIEQTILSVIDQNYPELRYAVQDAASVDETVEILKKHSSRITSWVSEPDTGQARAVASGFEKISGDIMAWLNSDDLLMPGALRFVGEYFRRHPEVDAIYGHRVIVDEKGREIGRWVLPPHDPEVLRNLDYVPQETLFWRESLWRKVGGISPDFRFALDWDLLLRFQKAGANIVRVPYYLGCFRVHVLQKTSAQIETVGNKEVSFLRLSTLGGHPDPKKLGIITQRVARQSAFCEWLLRMGIRW